jgi:hypothetical protein
MALWHRLDGKDEMIRISSFAPHFMIVSPCLDTRSETPFSILQNLIFDTAKTAKSF